MEIQIPLVLFTTLLAWSAGIFASQGIFAIKKQGAKCQMECLIAALVTLAVGGIAVVFHLAQPLHIFNGFGNPTSGITQELVAIVLLGIWMVVYFVMIRQSDDGNVPAWCGAIAIVLALVLDCVMSHSYMMESRPAWNNIMQIVSIVGASCMAGPATVALIAAIKGDECSIAKPLVAAGAVIGAAVNVVYLFVMNSVASQFVDLGNYFDPTHPNHAMQSVSNVSIFAAGSIAPTIVTIAALIAVVAAALIGAKKGEWKVWGVVVVVAALVAAFALRVTFYTMGHAALMFY